MPLLLLVVIGNCKGVLWNLLPSSLFDCSCYSCREWDLLGLEIIEEDFFHCMVPKKSCELELLLLGRDMQSLLVHSAWYGPGWPKNS